MKSIGNGLVFNDTIFNFNKVDVAKVKSGTKMET